MPMKTIDEALDVIYSYVDYSLTKMGQTDREVYTLDKITKLLEDLENPQNAYRIIHVAGTKGKGSVCAMTASALRNAGLNVGLYSSPHMLRTNERIMVNGNPIPDSDLIRLTEKISALVDPEKPVSTFEFLTAMAFEYFREQQVDVAVIETGLGGRLDTTNVVHPILTVITSISLDHTAILGRTVEAIAAEKGGIIKQGIPVICSEQSPKVVAALREIADKHNSPWIYTPSRYRWISCNCTDQSQQVVLWRVEDQSLMEKWLESGKTTAWQPVILDVPFAGNHQMQNAVTVYTILTKFKSIEPKINMNRMIEGIGNTFWPCRFEKLSDIPLVYADGAHNKDSAEKLGFLIDRYCGRMNTVCILGISEDKPLQDIIDALAPHVSRFIATKSTHPRAAHPQKLVRLAHRAGRECTAVNNIEEAYRLITSEQDQNTCYIVTGSLFVAAGIREQFMLHGASLPWYES